MDIIFSADSSNDLVSKMTPGSGTPPRYFTFDKPWKDALASAIDTIRLGYIAIDASLGPLLQPSNQIVCPIFPNPTNGYPLILANEPSALLNVLNLSQVQPVYANITFFLILAQPYDGKDNLVFPQWGSLTAVFYKM